jgi:hypothetical protein
LREPSPEDFSVVEEGIQKEKAGANASLEGMTEYEQPRLN